MSKKKASSFSLGQLFRSKANGKSRASSAQQAATPAEQVMGVIEDPAAIVSFLSGAMDENLPVQIFLGELAPPCYTLFEWETKEDQAGKIIQCKNFVTTGQYLLIAALDPPIGNVRIRKASSVNVQFFTKINIFRCEVPFEKITDTKSIRLGFPETIQAEPEKRMAFRVKVNPLIEVTAEIIRPSGVSFKIDIVDISVGGMAFCPVKTIPKMGEGAKITIRVCCPETCDVSLDAVFIGIVPRDGAQIFRARFLIGTQDEAISIETLVMHLQRQTVQTRQALFK